MAKDGELFAGGRYFFRFRFRWQRAIERLSDAEAGRLVKAMLYYSMTGDELSLPGKENGTFDALVGDLDADKEDAAYISRTNSENARNGWDARRKNISGGCDRMRPQATAGKEQRGKNKETPLQSPRRGRRRESSQYSAEDIAAMEANEVDLNVEDPAKEEQNE